MIKKSEVIDLGNLVCNIGPMFSGKTETLLQQFEDNKSPYSILIKSDLDGRYSGLDYVCTHNGKHSQAFPLHNSSDIEQLIENIKQEDGNLHRNYGKGVYQDDVVGQSEMMYNIFIDEAHFFDSGLVDVVGNLLSKNNVYATMLNFDHTGSIMTFRDSEKRVTDLFIYEPQVNIHYANCDVCGDSARYSMRLSDNEDKIEVGGADKYSPRCIDHFLD